jgi:hypothetical protein
MAMDRRLVLQHAVREGARTAAVSDDITAICNRTKDQAQGAINPGGHITLDYEDLDNNGKYNAGDNVKVTVPYDWKLPIVNSALPALHLPAVEPIHMNTTASARLERTMLVSRHEVCP